MLRVADVDKATLDEFVLRYNLALVFTGAGSDISGSFWGGCEAGIVGLNVHVRSDTPIHSLLHETCHIICMSQNRRDGLHGNAGSDDLEEAAVCYLQIVVADWLKGVGRDRIMADMDAWGYSFRVGNTRDWFQSDANDAKEFLLNHGLLTKADAPTFRLRA